MRRTPKPPVQDWADLYGPSPRARIRVADTARARIRNDGDLSCIARALTPEQAITRAAAALGYVEAGQYVHWADPAHVVAALEQFLVMDGAA